MANPTINIDVPLIAREAHHTEEDVIRKTIQVSAECTVELVFYVFGQKREDAEAGGTNGVCWN
jgi:hypothetical protein